MLEEAPSPLQPSRRILQAIPQFNRPVTAGLRGGRNFFHEKANAPSSGGCPWHLCFHKQA